MLHNCDKKSSEDPAKAPERHTTTKERMKLKCFAFSPKLAKDTWSTLVFLAWLSLLYVPIFQLFLDTLAARELWQIWFYLWQFIMANSLVISS
jgi:hypothetical protein